MVMANRPPRLSDGDVAVRRSGLFDIVDEEGLGRGRG